MDRVEGTRPQPTRRGLSPQLVAIATLALALRAYPLHVFYINPDQEWIPTMAMQSLAAGNWRPELLLYPSGLMYTLRVAYAAAYGVGRLLGRVENRVDFLASYIERPFPFLLFARAWSVLLGVAGVIVLARLAERVLGARGGLLAALFLALAFLHVRESHYGSLDVPATTFFTATLLAAVRLHESPALGTAVLAGLLGGVTIAHRYQLAVVLLALPAAELLRAPRPARGAAGRLAAAGLAALAAFFVLSPDTLLDAARTGADLRKQFNLSYRWSAPASLPLHTLLGLAAGPAMCLFAAIGMLACLRRRPRTALVLIAPLVPYAASLMLANRIFARYTVPMLPILALFGAAGVLACGRCFPRGAARAAVWLLAVVVLADPAARSVALDRLLAREDTRLAARRWIVEHVPDGSTLVVNPATYGAYGVLALPRTLEQQAARYGASLEKQLRARARDPGVPSYRYAGVEAAEATGHWVVTIDHPYLTIFGAVPDRLASLLGARATRVAEFVGLPEADADRVQFDPTDANYTPLRGLDRVARPGPNIRIWRIGPPLPDRTSARPGRRCA